MILSRPAGYCTVQDSTPGISGNWTEGQVPGKLVLVDSVRLD